MFTAQEKKREFTMPSGRPIKKRTVKSYTRDIEAIGRLRTAIYMDSSLERKESDEAVALIDKLVRRLATFVKSEAENEEESA
jgi:hypothetical protein